jgi:hypothetical protein
MANTYPSSGFACIDGIYSDVRVGGYPGSNDGILHMCITSNDYQAIRSYDGSTQTIHFFGRTWGNGTLGNSVGSINIEGICGVTFGPWNGPQMVLRKSDGFLGIGTSSPSALLHVNGTSFFGDTTNFVLGKISWNSTRFVMTSCGTANMAFATDDFTDRMTIQYGTGNVGIGTSAPGSKLVVCGSATGDVSNIRIISTDCYGGYVAYNRSSLRTTIGYGDDGNIFTGATAQSMAIRSENAMHLGANGNCIVMTLTSGRIGVGTTSPSYKLHVNGTFYAAGSSQDYKQRVCQYDTDSCMFMKLKPVTYQYKEEYKHLGKELKSETQIGLIAEDVADVMPELAILVNEEDNKIVRNVDYEKLSIVLLSEVQKLRKELDELKTK